MKSYKNKTTNRGHLNCAYLFVYFLYCNGYYFYNHLKILKHNWDITNIIHLNKINKYDNIQSISDEPRIVLGYENDYFPFYVHVTPTSTKVSSNMDNNGHCQKCYITSFKQCKNMLASSTSLRNSKGYEFT